MSAQDDRTHDPLSISFLTGVTERKLFGFKCTVGDGTLAEREAERRVRTFFAVLTDSRVVLLDATKQKRTVVPAEDILAGLVGQIRSLYRTSEKELSTANILADVAAFLRERGLVLAFMTADDMPS